MNFSRHFLDNGLRIIVIELPHVHSIEIGMFIKSGPRYESRETFGISHFVEHMLFRGTRSIPETFQLHAEVERLGSPIAASTSRDFCQFGFPVPPRNLERATELFAEIVQEPAFEDIELERQIILEEHLIDLDENGEDICLENHSRLLLWPGHSLGYDPLGSESNLREFTQEDLFAHHKRFYTAKNSVLYFVGAIEAGQVLPLARRCLARLPPGEPIPVNRVERVVEGPRYKFIDHDDSQEKLCLSFIAPSYTDPDHLSMLGLQDVLIEGMSSRLQWHICERLGMSYDIDAGLESYFDTGVFDVDSSVGRGKLVTLLREILAILEDLRIRPVDARELEKARERCRFANEAALDSPAALVGWLVSTELYGHAQSPEETLAAMERLTAEDIQRAARRVFRPSNLALVAEGRRSKSERSQLLKLIHDNLSNGETR